MSQRFRKVSIDDSVERIEGLVAGVEPRLRRRFLQLVEQLRDQRSVEELATLLNQGRFDEALVSAELGVAQLSSAWAAAFVVSAEDTSAFLQEAAGVLASFDTTNVRAVAAMRVNQLRLVRGFTREMRLATREALIDGIARGLNPRQQALLFRQSIGLTRVQVQAVANYRRLLEALSGESFARELRDRRFDRTVRRAISDQEPLSAAQVDRMVDRYAERQLAHRAEVIARTEALRSVHEGAEEMYQQAIDQGILDEDSITRIWHPRPDARTRGPHRAMRNQKRPIGVPFRSGLGNALRFPADPSAPAEDSVQCRCIVTHRFTIDIPAAQLGTPAAA